VTDQAIAKNPARIEPWPHSLPIDIALRVKPAPDVFRSYGLDKADYERLCADDSFRAAIQHYVDALAAGGGQMSFKLKSQLMADQLLDEAFRLTHPKPGDDIPPSVQADMIKSVVKWGGLDGSLEKAGGGNSGNQLQIVLNLGD
jgi:hypothetical protein